MNKKINMLESTLGDFEDFLSSETDSDKIMDFIQDVKNKKNIALSLRNSDLSGGIGLESYMGSRHLILKNENTKEVHKVILGEQFPKMDIKSGDSIKVVGFEYDYGYIFAQKIIINDVEVEGYYEIVPSKFEQQLNKVTISLENNIYFEGKVQEIVPEDNTYSSLSDVDLYLSLDEKKNIISHNRYVTKVSKENSLDELLISTERFSNGYLIAITPLSEVNDVIGTMNSYYFIVFAVAFLLVIVISLIYSRFMTRPLVEMSNVAKRISQCDFNDKYNVKSEDEIGLLGESLNLISNNLEKTLSELQDTNDRLKKEINIKEVQEDKRKELIANISHELKTPITIIQGSINGIKSGIYGAEMYEDILEETNRMNDLVKEMLDISKLESPSFDINKEPFDLGAVFLKEKDKLRDMIKEKSLEINYNDFDDAIVFGDEKRITQVVTNLLTNAIKYTPDSGKINVLIEPIKEKGQYEFSIENFGVSLSKEELENVWDAFYRKEKSRNKKFGGTGLGLSIVKRILELHNSDFGVESTENSVKFYFSIQECTDY
ncbi:MAG: HAMP domain-containing histidine kinase [Clostridium sp.]|nr:HAMP domain-containing histidine kinase [Clostridium sp.]